jgi:hypothetical protein
MRDLWRRESMSENNTLSTVGLILKNRKEKKNRNICNKT